MENIRSFKLFSNNNEKSKMVEEKVREKIIKKE